MCEYLWRIYLVPNTQILHNSVKIPTNNTENIKLKKHNLGEYNESEEWCALRGSNKTNAFHMGLEWPAKSKT